MILIVTGKAIDLPGALATSIVAGAGLFGYLVFGVFQSRNSTIPIRRVMMAMGIATLVMGVAIGNSNVRFIFYVLLSDDLQRRMGTEDGQQNLGEAAIDAYRKADRYVPHHEPRRTRFHNRFGLLYDSLGQLDAAVLQFRKAVRIEPDRIAPRVNLGQTLVNLGQVDEGIGQLRKVIHDQPESMAALNGLAWILATHAREDVRDPAEAVDLARRAAALTRHENAAILDTLAAAYAAAGRYDQAEQTAQKALDLARVEYPAQFVHDLSNRLDLFRERKPYRETVGFKQ